MRNRKDVVNKNFNGKRQKEIVSHHNNQWGKMKERNPIFFVHSKYRENQHCLYIFVNVGGYEMTRKKFEKESGNIVGDYVGIFIYI